MHTDVVLIDDLRSFKQGVIFSGTTLKIFRTSKEALSYFREGNTATQVWWDHDLGGDDTTIPVAEYIAGQAQEGIVLVRTSVVHTSNLPGGDRLMRTLKGVADGVNRTAAHMYLFNSEGV